MALKIDVQKVTTATNHVHSEVFKGKAALKEGKFDEAAGHFKSAVNTACEIMTELVNDDFESMCDEIGRARDVEALTKFVTSNPDAIGSFLRAEENALLEAGVDPQLVDAVMDRCIEFTEQPPAEWTGEDLMQAFRSAKFRICTTAREHLDKLKHDEGSSWTYRRIGRTALRVSIGTTLIVVDYKFLGPAEFFCQLSTGYGLTYIPDWKPGQKK